ncbi:phosphatase PAP2 family protein [Staphylococcus sp. NRL 16/872]|uniref:phosphatase PAP2 family protein n=1 Tax=Staphylococcus sp. NRL 16/872 TaxID=2930131 RepID=UPI001FB4069B|nr:MULTISPECIES: phosphatase PAP2 family protein [unclassified Staphylococcus]MCJ1662752.1 phosphatase PAP2 family protein [Staphylococcus sp. NRL 18/288]MCJ1668861.1 phosphatase PAP2 family protein [Staphylococcus sp. NRL 19/737]WEN69077.1 phosphatase PAP2 family protein [Staphylococcus sp. NRL 16/872]
MTISKKLSTTVLSILLLIIVISTFLDQPISNLLMDQNSLFGTIFQNYGLFPPTLVLIITMIILNYYIFTTFENKFTKLIILLISSVFTIIKTNALVSETVQYILSTSNNIKHHKPMGMANNEGNAGHALSLGLSFLISLIILVVITFICYYFWLKNTNTEELNRLFKVSLISFMVLFVGLELVGNMKELWGRVRPYELTDKASHFTNWLTINGNTGHSSFPSGHTGNGAFLMFLAFYFKKLSSRKIMFIIGLIYSVLMALSRIRIGAHFTSDVTMSLIIMFSLMLIGDYLINKITTNQNKQ